MLYIRNTLRLWVIVYQLLFHHGSFDPNFSVHIYILTLLGAKILEQQVQEQEQYPGGGGVGLRRSHGLLTGQGLPLQQQAKVSWCERSPHWLLKDMGGRVFVS